MKQHGRPLRPAAVARIGVPAGACAAQAPPESSRIARVLEMVRPYMQPHGGDVELAEVRGDTAFVRLHGACNGCSMSAVTLRDGVEEAVLGQIPEIRKVEVLPNAPGPGLISPDSVGVRGADPAAGWVRGPAVAELPAGTMAAARFGDAEVLLVNLKSRLSAGMAPIYVANEGRLVAIVARDDAERTLATLRAHPLGARAAIIGEVTADHPGVVVARTAIGGTRVVDMQIGEQLPRIC